MRKRLQDLYDAARRAPRASVAVLTALMAFGLSGLVFLAASEDVVERDGATRLDPQRLDWIVRHRSGPLVAVARFLDTAGSVPVVLVLALLLALWFWHRGLPVAIAGLPAAAFLLAEAMVAVLKPLVGRDRPGAALRLVVESEPSFPSGHATGATAFAVSVATIIAIYVLRRPVARALTVAAGLLLPAAVAGSRLELGVHWPTDVVAGMALGAGTAVAVGAAAVWVTNRTRIDPTPPGPTSWSTSMRTRVVAILTRSRRRPTDPMVASA